MSLYAHGQRVWSRSQQSLGIVTEANYLTAGGRRRAVYVVDLVSGVQRLDPATGRLAHERLGIDWMCGSGDLRAADYCCDGCGRYLPGQPHATGPDGEYPNGMGFCFLCAGPPAERAARRDELAELERLSRDAHLDVMEEWDAEEEAQGWDSHLRAS